MSSIDERIVEMRFDNKDFEKGVKTTMDSLDKLQESLKLEGSAKGLDDLQRSANLFTLSNVESNVESLTNTFSTLGIIGMRALENITDRAMTMGERLIKSLTIDQVSSGFSKYEQKLNSVQVIMNATGLSIDEVNESLDKLNWFTDETSYSFTDMVNNISKFTSSKIPLGDAVTSMIGIADAAGLAGASTTDASHAMDGFSKAIAQGYMSRQNWQWIRTAHMDTAQFKETLIETAEELGQLQRTGDETWATLGGNAVSIQDFETGLHDAWMTTEVMNKALAKFGGTTERVYEFMQEHDEIDKTSDAFEKLGISADDLGLKSFKAAQEAKTFTDAINSVKDAVSTGWMTTFEHLFGNYEKAKVMWTNLANDLWDIFAAPGDARNEMLAEWNELGGQEVLIEGLTYAFHTLEEAIFTVKEAFRNLFPAMTAERLYNLTVRFRDFAERMYNAFGYVEEKLEPLEDVFKAAGKAISPIVEGMEQVGEVTEEVAETFADLDEIAQSVINGLYGNGEYRRNALTEAGYSYERVQNKVNELLGCSYRYEIAEEKVAKAIDDVTEATKENNEATEDAIGETKRIYSVSDNLRSTLKGLFSIVNLLKQAISAIARVGAPIIGFIGRVGKAILGVTGAIGDILTDFTLLVEEHDIFYTALKEFADFLYEIFQPAFEKIEEVLESLAQREFLDEIIEKFKKFDEETKFTETAGNLIQGVFEGITKAIEISIGAIGSFIGKLKEIPWLTMLSDVFGRINTFISGLDFSFVGNGIKFVGGKLKSVQNIFKDFWGVFGSYEKTMAQWRAKSIFYWDWNKIFGENGGGFRKIFSWWSSDADTFNEQLVELAGSEEVLADVTKNTSGVFRTILSSVGNFGNRLLDIFDSIKERVSKISLADIIKNLMKFGQALGIIAVLFSGSFAFTKIGNFFDSFGGLLESISVTFKSISFNMASKSLVNIAILIASIAAVLWVLKDYDKDQLITAGEVIGGLLIAIAAIMWALSASSLKGFGKSMAVSSLGILAIAGSLLLIVGILKTFADMDVHSFAKGVGYLVVCIGVLLGAVWALQKLQVNLGFLNMMALYAFAYALKTFVQILVTLAQQDLKMISRSMAEIIAIMAVAAKFASGLKFSSGTAMMGIAISLWLFIKVLQKVCEFPMETIINGLGQLIVIFGLFVGLMYVAGRFGGYNVGQAGRLFAGLGLVLVLAAAAMYILAKIPSDTYKQALIGIGAILVFLAGMMYMLTFVSNMIGKGRQVANLSKFFISLGVAFAVMIAAIYILGKMDIDQLNQGLATFAVLSVLLDVMMGMAAFIKGSYKSLIALAVLIAVMAAVFKVLADIPFKQMAAVSGGLGMAIGVIVAAMWLIGKAKPVFIAAEESLVILATTLLIVGAELALGIALIAGAGWLAATAFKTFAEAMKELTDIPSSSIKTTMADLAEGFGAFGESLKRYPFGSLLKAGAAIEFAEAVETIAEPIITLSNLADQVDEKGVSKLTTYFDILSKGFAKFAESLKDTDWSAESQAKAMTSMAEASSILAASADDISNIDTEKMSTGLQTIGEAFKLFDETLNGNTYFGMNARATGMAALAGCVDDLATALPKMADIPSETIEAALTGIATAFHAFSDVLSDDYYWGMQSRGEAIAILVNSVGSLADGVVKFKEMDADTVKEVLTTLGQAFKDFGDAISGSGFWDTERANGISTLVDNVSKLADGAQYFSEQANYETFSTSLTQIGNAFKSFGTAIQNVGLFNSEAKANALTIVISSLQDLATAANRFRNINDLDVTMEKVTNAITKLAGLVRTGLVGLESGAANLTTIGNGLQDLANGLLIFDQNVSAEVPGKIDAVGQSLANLANSMNGEDGENGIIATIITSLVAELENSAETLIMYGQSLMEKIIEGIQLKYEEFTAAGWKIVELLIEGMASKHLIAKAAGMTLANKVLSGITFIANDNVDGAFYLAGANAAQGFIDGLQSKLDAAWAAGQLLGSTALEGAMAALQEHSPSKAMRQVGSYAGEGLVDGLTSWQDKVYNAASNMASSALTGAEYVLSSIGEALDANLDTDPVITPVIDLEGVREGARQLNGVIARSAAMNANLGFETNQNEGGLTGREIKFYQYNTSPKALSQIEIYRQTKNQLSFAKGVLSN